MESGVVVREAFVRNVLPLYDGYRDAAQFAVLTDRILFYMTLVERLRPANARLDLLDLGGGLSPFAPLCAALGDAVTLIDDFGGGGGIDPACRDTDLAVIDSIRARGGVRVVERDFISSPLPVDDASIDVVTSFHSIEHWHSSPGPLFGELKRVLRPRGHIVIGCPNAVNLRKRVWVLFGRTNHCSLDEWYYDGTPFRGHVREPTMGELCTLLSWNGFDVVDACGRNFLAEHSESLPTRYRSAWRAVLRLADPFLRGTPTLCSDIHVIGRLA